MRPALFTINPHNWSWNRWMTTRKRDMEHLVLQVMEANFDLPWHIIYNARLVQMYSVLIRRLQEVDNPRKWWAERGMGRSPLQHLSKICTGVIITQKACLCNLQSIEWSSWWHLTRSISREPMRIWSWKTWVHAHILQVRIHQNHVGMG